jgi:hypothetical protein
MVHGLSVTDDMKESQYKSFDGTKIRLFVDEALSSSIVLCSLMCSITVVDKPIKADASGRNMRKMKNGVCWCGANYGLYNRLRPPGITDGYEGVEILVMLSYA